MFHGAAGAGRHRRSTGWEHGIGVLRGGRRPEAPSRCHGATVDGKAVKAAGRGGTRAGVATLASVGMGACLRGGSGNSRWLCGVRVEIVVDACHTWSFEVLVLQCSDGRGVSVAVHGRPRLRFGDSDRVTDWGSSESATNWLGRRPLVLVPWHWW